MLILAIDTAEEAARIILEDPMDNRRVDVDLPRDIKIVADKRIEGFIIQKLSGKSRYPILSEESEFVVGHDDPSHFRWIVDPVDGSLNFSRGIPMSCISIGLWEGMEPLMGVICDFNRNETFSGLVGEGAWLNGVPISVSEVREKSKAVLCTGFSAHGDFSVKYLESFIEDLRSYKKIRLLGSAALSLAYVACGRADCYCENYINLWDIAGGLALVKAAGGAIHFQPANSSHSFHVIASTPYLSA